MNENPSVGIQWPNFKERSERLAEAVALIRQSWTEERVSFEGKYYRTLKATIYDRPEQAIPIVVAADGPQAAALVGQIGDGFIVTSGKDERLYQTLLDGLREGANKRGRDPQVIPKFIEIKVSYDHDPVFAREACKPWAALALTPEEKHGREDPIEIERLASGAEDLAHSRFVVSNDPEEIVDKIYFPGDDQPRALDQFAGDVLPLLESRCR